MSPSQEPDREAPSDAAPKDEFFVGYLPMPARLQRFQRLAVPLAVLLALGCAVLLAKTMTPVRARFSSEPTILTGIFRASPVPTLWVHDLGESTRARGILVVQGGKFGVSQALIDTFDQHAVRATGVLLERDGLGMLELSRPPTELTVEDIRLAPMTSLSEVPQGHVHLRGELVDSKCWIGRMRPGLGRTHRACAQQCVAGGIPPIFVTRDANGRETAYPLADIDDDDLNLILPLLADSVEAEGELFSIGSLWMLRLDPNTLRRL